jgi:Tol biopolymer transport system component
MRRVLLAMLAALASVAGCTRVDEAQQNAAPAVAIDASPGEAHFGQIRQITSGGENAESYWSSDGRWITMQSRRDGLGCDQQFVMRADGSDVRKISVGGKTTCGFFFDGDRRVLFSSSHAADTACPPRPDASAGYVWALDAFDIYTANRDGSNLRRLTNYNVYTAESIVSPDGKSIVFTSLKDGDLDIYTMNIDGSNVRRLTTTHGYDGGPWWSPDGTKIVYRAHHPADSAERAQYDTLLARRLVRPSKVELWVMNADGSDQRQITRLGGANFGPSWTPDGTRIVFSSNYKTPRSGNFDLFLINLDGSGLEQITFHESFDGFPMFSPDGSQLMWASNRHAAAEGETNVFIAEWRP